MTIGLLACAGTKDINTESESALTPVDAVNAGADVGFDVLLSAAFREFALDGDAYADLHRQHLGVTQPAPDASSCPTWPETDPGARILRLGFVAEEPVHTVNEVGEHVGFEADLASELVRRINAHYENSNLLLEWVPVQVELPIGPLKNSTQFDVLASGLRAGAFDVAFSSIIPVEAPDVAYLCPTMVMFPGVVYTGRDNLDVSSIQDRDSLVEFLVAHRGMTFVHGMGQAVYDALVADVNRAGGSISLAEAGSTPHFRMADILGLLKRSSLASAQGTLLDVNPRTDVQPKATFVLRR